MYFSEKGKQYPSILREHNVVRVPVGNTQHKSSDSISGAALRKAMYGRLIGGLVAVVLLQPVVHVGSAHDADLAECLRALYHLDHANLKEKGCLNSK